MYIEISEINGQCDGGSIRSAPIIHIHDDPYFVDEDHVIPAIVNGTEKAGIDNERPIVLIHMPLSWLTYSYRSREACVKTAVALWVQRGHNKSLRFVAGKIELANLISTSRHIIFTGLNELAEMGWVKREPQSGQADIITIVPPVGTSMEGNGCVKFDGEFIHAKIDIAVIRSLGEQRGLALMIYLYLYRKAMFDKRRVCRATTRWLSGKLGVAHNNIYNIIKRLDGEGLVSRRGMGGDIVVIPQDR